MILTVFVPRAGSLAERLVAARSAVVGDPGVGFVGSVLCHFEGAVYDQANMRTFHQRLCHAAWRLVTHYPTTAMARFDIEDLIPAATFDADRMTVVEITDPLALTTWALETAEEIQGVRLPVGEVAWNVAARVSGRHFGPTVGPGRPWWFRTQAGQIVAFNADRQQAVVYDHTDPELADRLEGVPLPELERLRVFGKRGTPTPA